MITIEQLLGDIQRSTDQMADGPPAAPTVFARPQELLAAFMAGERRRLESQARFGVPVPRFCLFSVTWRCNLGCTGCYAKNYVRGKELRIEEIERVIRDARDLGSYIFVIVGGEPLLVPGLMDVMARVDDALFLMFTNGTLLDDARADEIARARRIMPIVSTEGEAEDTDQRRGCGVSAKVSAAMDALASKGVPFGFSSMVTRRNLDRVTSREWFDEMWDLGARLGFLIDYIPFPQGLDESLVLRPEDYAPKYDAVLARYREARPLVMNFPADEYDGGNCQAAGIGFIHVNADGFVEPCPFSHYACENVRDKPLHDILAGPFLSTIRREVSGLPNPHRKCLLFEYQDRVAEIARSTGGFATERAID